MRKSFKGEMRGTIDGQVGRFVGEFIIDDAVPPPPPPPPPPPEAIVSLSTNSALIQTHFEEHVKLGADFRTVPGGSRLQSRRNATANGIFCQQGRILFPINYIAPYYHAGVMRTGLPANPPNGHCQVRLHGEELEQGAWTKPEVTYRWGAGVELPSSSLWSELSWVLPMQCHPGAYGPDWENMHHRPPAIAVYMKRDHWEFWVRGSNEVRPTKNTHNTVYGRRESELVPFTPGLNTLGIEFRCAPLSDKSFVVFHLNGKRLVEITHPVGLNHSALGAGKPALNMAMGYYGTQPANLPNPSTQGGVVDIISTTLSDIS